MASPTSVVFKCTYDKYTCIRKDMCMSQHVWCVRICTLNTGHVSACAPILDVYGLDINHTMYNIFYYLASRMPHLTPLAGPWRATVGQIKIGGPIFVESNETGCIARLSIFLLCTNCSRVQYGVEVQDSVGIVVKIKARLSGILLWGCSVRLFLHTIYTLHCRWALASDLKVLRRLKVVATVLFHTGAHAF